MTGLFTSDDIRIARYIRIVPKQDSIKIEHRLLDGSFHLQVVGEAADLLKVSLQVLGEANRARVDQMSQSCEVGSVVLGNTIWKGLIRGNLTWEKQASVYQTTFDFLITEILVS